MRIRRQHNDIELLIGLETDFITSLDLDGLDSLLSKHKSRIDYIVGSIHHVNELPIDLDRATFQQALASFGDGTEEEQWTRLAASYFDAQLTLMERFRPEIIGHFDLCRLYKPTFSFKSVWAKVERNVRFAIGYGALFECNAAAFRKGWETAYPGEDVAKVCQFLGGVNILTSFLSSISWNKADASCCLMTLMDPMLLGSITTAYTSTFATLVWTSCGTCGDLLGATRWEGMLWQSRWKENGGTTNSGSSIILQQRSLFTTPRF